MIKILDKYKFVVLMCVLALAIFVPCSDLLVQASAFDIFPISIAVDDDNTSSGESGTTGTEGGSSGSTETTEETTFDGFAIGTSIITDGNLYNELLRIYKSTDSNYTGSTIYSDMFKEFTELKLDNKNISTLAGLEKLDLNKLETFSADMNNISTFDEQIFTNTNSNVFKNLSLAGNSLSKFEITSTLGLTNLNLSSNSLSRLDLSKIEARDTDTEFTLNVANNNFTDMANIVLPSRRIGHINVNIINNQITSLDESYFTDKYSFNIGIMGFQMSQDKYVVDTKSNVVVYKTNLPNIRIDIFKVDGASDVLVASVKDSDITDKCLRLNLGVGEYEYEYVLDAENTNAYDRYNSDSAYLGSNRFNIIPQKVTCLYNFKGKDYESLNKVTGEVIVKLFCEDGATIMYQVNGGEWTQGNVINCNTGGTYSIKAKAVIDGVESEESNIWVRTSLNLYISDGLMLAIVLIIALTLFLVVVPVISKKYFKKD